MMNLLLQEGRGLAHGNMEAERRGENGSILLYRVATLPVRIRLGRGVLLSASFLQTSEKGSFSMESHLFSVGNRVRIVSYSPFRGRRGTIRTIHRIPSLEEPFCFYQIELEGTYLKKAMWFKHEEVELIYPSEVPSPKRAEHCKTEDRRTGSSR